MNVGIQLYIEPVTSKISKFYVVETLLKHLQRGVFFKHRTYDGVISDIHMRDLKSWPGVI